MNYPNRPNGISDEAREANSRDSLQIPEGFGQPNPLQNEPAPEITPNPLQIFLQRLQQELNLVSLETYDPEKDPTLANLARLILEMQNKQHPLFKLGKKINLAYGLRRNAPALQGAVYANEDEWRNFCIENKQQIISALRFLTNSLQEIAHIDSLADLIPAFPEPQSSSLPQTPQPVLPNPSTPVISHPGTTTAPKTSPVNPSSPPTESSFFGKFRRRIALAAAAILSVISSPTLNEASNPPISEKTIVAASPTPPPPTIVSITPPLVREKETEATPQTPETSCPNLDESWQQYKATLTGTPSVWGFVDHLPETNTGTTTEETVSNILAGTRTNIWDSLGTSPLIDSQLWFRQVSEDLSQYGHHLPTNLTVSTLRELHEVAEAAGPTSSLAQYENQASAYLMDTGQIKNTVEKGLCHTETPIDDLTPATAPSPETQDKPTEQEATGAHNDTPSTGNDTPSTGNDTPSTGDTPSFTGDLGFINHTALMQKAIAQRKAAEAKKSFTSNLNEILEPVTHRRSSTNSNLLSEKIQALTNVLTDPAITTNAERLATLEAMLDEKTFIDPFTKYSKQIKDEKGHVIGREMVTPQYITDAYRKAKEAYEKLRSKIVELPLIFS